MSRAATESKGLDQARTPSRKSSSGVQSPRLLLEKSPSARTSKGLWLGLPVKFNSRRTGQEYFRLSAVTHFVSAAAAAVQTGLEMYAGFTKMPIE
jgi:hypothetical protein